MHVHLKAPDGAKAYIEKGFMAVEERFNFQEALEAKYLLIANVRERDILHG